MRFARRSRRPSWLDMSPLIDCVLQLLIFFMLTSTFATPRLELDLPRAGREARTPEPAGVRVSVLADGAIRVGRTPTTLARVAEVLRRALDARDSKRVTFRGDANVPLGLAIRVLAEARRAGAQEIDVAYEPLERASGEDAP